jgi:hypothetical protein
VAGEDKAMDEKLLNTVFGALAGWIYGLVTK